MFQNIENEHFPPPFQTIFSTLSHIVLEFQLEHLVKKTTQQRHKFFIT